MSSPEAARHVYDALRPRADAERPTCVIRRYQEIAHDRALFAEVLVTEYSTGEVEIAERPTKWNSWGPPRLMRLVSEEGP